MDEIALIKAKLDDLYAPDGSLALRVAQKLISDSAWWYGHPSGPVAAPKHYKNVAHGPYGWQLQFGANKFLVERAFHECAKLIRQAMQNSVATKSKIDCKQLKEHMSREIRFSVSNFQDEAGFTLWEIADNGHMRFGTQSINVTDFVRCIFGLLELDRLCI